MISVDKAIEIIQSSIQVIKQKERVSLFEAAGRVLSEDIKAPSNVPPKNNSSMDGYAAIYSDIKQAPAKLKVIDEVRAGQKDEGKFLESGYAIRIMTGHLFLVVLTLLSLLRIQRRLTVQLLLKKMILCNMKISGLPGRI
jgi:molybdopterin biosynthesis enzyme